MATMRAVQIRKFGGPEVLELVEVERPEPRPGEIRVRVRAAGVNPVDWKTREGRGAAGMLQRPLPIILGWDFSGEVDALGPGITTYRPGDAVYGMVRIPEQGTYAEYVCVPVEHTALKPASLTHEAAAALPLVGLTAYQALFEAARIQPGERVLVHAGAGGVGHVAIQLARGAEVFATASAANADFVRGLGAAQVIDHRSERFEEKLRDLDVVIDTVGGEVTARSFQVLRRGGRLVSILGTPDAELARKAGVEAHWVFVHPSGEQLREVARLVEAGKLSPHVDAVLPLSEVSTALARSQAGHTRGKLVLRIGDAAR